MGLYCSKQLETTFHQFCEKPLHITFKFALTPHHVWKYGRHPICGGWD